MKTIHKYELNGTGLTCIEMPENASIIKAASQNNRWWIWAVVDTNAVQETRNLMVMGTGWEVNHAIMNHIDTFLEGAYVWHVFEVF